MTGLGRPAGPGLTLTALNDSAGGGSGSQARRGGMQAMMSPGGSSELGRALVLPVFWARLAVIAARF